MARQRSTGPMRLAGLSIFSSRTPARVGVLVFRSGVHRDRNVGDEGTCGARADVQPGPSCAGVGGRAPGYSLAGNIGLPLGTQGLPMSVSRRVGRLRRTGRFKRADALGLVAAGGPSPRDTAQVWGSPRWVGTSSCSGTSGRLWRRGGSPTCMRTMPVAGSPGGSTIVIPIPVAGCSGVRWSTAFRRFWWGIGGGPRPAFRALPGARRFPWRIIGPMRRRLPPWKQTRTVSRCTPGSPAVSPRNSAVSSVIIRSWPGSGPCGRTGSRGTSARGSARAGLISSSSTPSMRLWGTTLPRASVPGVIRNRM